MSWTQRTVVAFAAVSAFLSMLALFGGLNPLDLASTGQSDPEAWFYSATCAFGLLAAVIIAVERGIRQAAWLAMSVVLLGVISLILARLGVVQGLESSIAGLFFGNPVTGNEPMPPLVALSLILTGSLVSWLALARPQRGRVPCFALLGSLLGATGMITLMGYVLKMPVAYRWGSVTSLPPSIALLMLLAGCTLLAIAWREHHSAQAGAPSWLPVPVVTTCGLLTFVFWAGLRERETLYLSTTGQIAINSFASAINLEFERQCAALERIGRRWSGDNESPVWEADAATWMIDAPGARSLARVAPDGTTQWYWPTAGNEALIGLNQLSQPARRDALELAARDGAPVVSSSLPLTGRSPGFVIYSPIYRARTPVAFIGAEFTYRQFFGTIDQRTKITLNHHCEVYINSDQILYDSIPGLESAEKHPLALSSIFTLENRRIRIVMAPTAEFLRQNQRSLPEISLAAGLGITLLLGLSIHLARTARASLASAETSNRRLRGENEERRRIETMLKVSDERLRIALDATSISIFEWNLATNELQHSVGLSLMLGRPPADTVSTPEAWQALVHPDDLNDYRAALARQLGGSQDFIDPEYRMRTATGEWRWFYARSKTVAYNATGEPARIVGTLQDITVRKESEQALRQSQAAARKLSLVASRTDNLVLIGTPDGAVEWVNESFERVMEYTLKEIVGKKPLELMAGTATNRETLGRIKLSIAKGEVLSTEVVNYSKSGRKYHLQLEIQPVRNEKGVLENFIAVETDITARVETENALRRAKAEADTASRTKSEFLASMSHEIRTPMNGVIGMTSLLLDTPMTPEQRDSVSTIRTSGEALLSIINDILDFSKIESGKLEIEHQPFELVSSIEETFDLFAVQASTRKIELAYDIDPAVPLLLIGDANRLRQVLTNLVNNAIKFTPSGSVSIEVSLDLESDPTLLRPRHRMISIAVRDTGIGIPADRLDRLFKPFSQVDSSITRKYGGTGLGLAICQRLCTLMGGSIRVHSDVRNGSTFTITLQVEAAEDGAPTRFTLPGGLGKGPVVCAENNAITLRRLGTFFRNAGIEMLTATTTEALVEIVQRPSAPVAVILDMDLDPAADGTTPQSLLISRKIPVLGLLPSAQFPLPDWTVQTPFTSAVKPLRTFALVRALNALFSSPTAATSPGKEAEPLNLSKEFPLNVLLAEDNPVNQKVALRFLDRLGYKADAVANGIEAVKAVTEGNYQLVFMDLQMPEMDGMEATRRIRRTLPRDRQPCIVALTANAMPSDRDRCLEIGMNGFITKPVKLFEIADFIRRHFGAKPGGTSSPFAPPAR
ncbi:MAG: ATP-binding protein [Opitutaceae bacterium]